METGKMCLADFEWSTKLSREDLILTQYCWDIMVDLGLENFDIKQKGNYVYLSVNGSNPVLVINRGRIESVPCWNFSVSLIFSELSRNQLIKLVNYMKTLRQTNGKP